MTYRSTKILAGLWVVIVLIGGAAMGQTIDVFSCGAVGDGRHDDTAAIQDALNKAATRGLVVQLPAGQYCLRGVLDIPEGVTLAGAWPGVHTSHLDKGTVLLAYAGRDQLDAEPFIMLHTSSSLRGITIFYPEQTVEDVRPYPWTVCGQGQHFSLENVTIANAYQGIDIGTHHNEGPLLRNVHMCALHKGVWIDCCTDIGRLENVHVHNVYWWRVSEPYRLTARQCKQLEDYTLANLTGFIINRCDWDYFTNCFVIWAKVGFHFLSSPSGAANVMLTQSGSDDGPTAVLIDNCQPHAGLAFNNCQMFGDIIVTDTNQGPVKFVNCGFFGSRDGERGVRQALLDGVGLVSFDQCHFTSLSTNKNADVDIRVNKGSLRITNCEFLDAGQEHIHLSPETRLALIKNNIFYGAAAIRNEAQANTLIADNLSYSPALEPGCMVIDDSEGANGFRVEGEWHTGRGGADFLGRVHWAYNGDGHSRAFWTPEIDLPGKYQVSVWYGADPNHTHATDAPFVVHHKHGETTHNLNLRENCGQWNVLGEYEFEKGQQGWVMTNNQANGHVLADAVKFCRLEDSPE